MITLALDASTYVGDVAILDGPRVLAEESVAMKGAEHERLMPAVMSTLRSADVDVDAIQRVVCGAGPGSFTSLRIAGAISKGIARGIGAPLFAVQSMALIVAGAERLPGRYLAVVDALRGEAYVALYEVDADRRTTEIEPARIIGVADIDAVAIEYGAKTIGPARDLCSIVANPRTRAVASLEDTIAASGAVDLASWEPAYGRLAEAQVKWETAHGRPLPAG